jgi:hypothetical protein
MLTNAVWNKLGQPATGSTGLVALRLYSESRFNVFAALDRVSGHRFLLLKSDAPNLRPARSLPSGRGFTTQFVRTPSDPDGSSCVQFELADPAYADVFDVVGNDVLSHVLRAADDRAAFDAFVARIDEWQHFLDQLPHEGLSEQAQQGLFAELWFLHRVLLQEAGPQSAVGAWAGPKALAKDFQFTGLTFEVKASSAKQHSRFGISNELQLDPRGQRLILYGLLLERVVASGMSLVELVSSIRSDLLQADPSSAVRFSELLLQSGYSDSDAWRYTVRFAIRSQHFFDVRDDFPRIVETDLRRGVGDVRYSILQSECERFAITEDEVRASMRAILTAS